MKFLLIYPFFVFVFLGVFSCNSLIEKPISPQVVDYLKQIPNDEEINASILHYEKLVSSSKEFFSNQQYFKVLASYERYLEVFFESEVVDESELLYLVGKSITTIIDTPEFLAYVKTNKQHRKNLGITKAIVKKIPYSYSNTQDYQLVYNLSHFLDIIFQRKNYGNEKKAIQEVYLSKLIDLDNTIPVINKKNGNSNFEYLYYLVTRYPNLFSKPRFASLFQKKQYYLVANLKKSNREKYSIMTNLIKIYGEYQKKLTAESDDNYFFSDSVRLVVRNRTHVIQSRNLSSIELWQPFKIIKEVVGEDKEMWYQVVFGDSIGVQEPSYGYVKKNQKSEKLIEVSSNNLNIDKEIFLEFLALFNSKKYLDSLEKITYLLNNTDFHVERTVVWYQQNLRKIAERSTAHNTGYTKFVKEYPEFFTVTEDKINLRPADFLVDWLFQLNSQSAMLQYLAP